MPGLQEVVLHGLLPGRAPPLHVREGAREALSEERLRSPRRGVGVPGAVAGAGLGRPAVPALRPRHLQGERGRLRPYDVRQVQEGVLLVVLCGQMRHPPPWQPLPHAALQVLCRVRRAGGILAGAVPRLQGARQGMQAAALLTWGALGDRRASLLAATCWQTQRLPAAPILSPSAPCIATLTHMLDFEGLLPCSRLSTVVGHR
mmetsp:Transcript_34437/g.97842  ORF Transcript_34437/g.97842 Transcript_34437/m.97842 type:complete len:203 (+) Transcript_34437:756-1364(+)